eukprot:EG_transcript_16250
MPALCSPFGASRFQANRVPPVPPTRHKQANCAGELCPDPALTPRTAWCVLRRARGGGGWAELIPPSPRASVALTAGATSARGLPRPGLAAAPWICAVYRWQCPASVLHPLRT